MTGFWTRPHTLPLPCASKASGFSGNETIITLNPTSTRCIDNLQASCKRAGVVGSCELPAFSPGRMVSFDGNESRSYPSWLLSGVKFHLGIETGVTAVWSLMLGFLWM